MPRYRFVGRNGDGSRYIWEAPIPGDSRVSQVSCGVAWFWMTPEERMNSLFT